MRLRFRVHPCNLGERLGIDRAPEPSPKLAQHLDWNFTAVGDPMKQSSGGPMDVGHSLCHPRNR